jgi:hypothetical protein
MTAARICDDFPELDYHRDPALSASGAKRLLPPNCPALFKHDRDNGGRPNKRAFDVGHAAHAAVLGVGLELVVVDADDWRTAAARAQRDAAYAEGKCPILAKEKSAVDEMERALRRHPAASALLDPEHGQPEVSVFWHDKRRGIDRRARFDWLPHTDGGQIIVPDYKTTASAEPHAFAKSVFKFGYDIQAVFYTDAIRAAGIAEDVIFRFIAQETTPPYLITIHELDFASLALGRARVDEACAVFRECTETGVWPGYSDDIELIGPPPWLASQYGLDGPDRAGPSVRLPDVLFRQGRRAGCLW